MKKILIVAVLSIFSCVSKSKKNDIKLIPLINLDNAKIDNVPAVGPIYQFNKLKDGGYDMNKSCSSKSIYYKQGEVVFDCISFPLLPGVVFRQIDDTIALYKINFAEFEKTVLVNDFKFNKGTIFSDVQEYVSKDKLELSESAAFPYNSEGMIGLYLDQSGPYPNRPWPFNVRLIFRNDSLKHFEYDWYPAYSDEEWKNYLAVKNKN